MNKLDKYLIWAILYIVGWSIAFFIAWLVLEMEPTVLEGCILAPGVVEMIACALIKRGNSNDKTADNSEIDEP